MPTTTTDGQNKKQGVASADDFGFPMEYNEVKEKLKIALQVNSEMMRHIEVQDNQLTQLKKYKAENQESMNMSQPMIASKLVEITRKNRDMTAKVESMKTKMQMLINENEFLKERMLGMEKTNAGTNSDCSEPRPFDSPCTPSQKTNEGILSSTRELDIANNKIMSYRRQCQQLRIELRTAERALAQEVGEGTSPQTVLSHVNSSSWRGRQQQIMTLTQKLAETQVKLSQLKESQPNEQRSISIAGEGDQIKDISPAEDAELALAVQTHAIRSASQKHIDTMQKKKQDNLDSVTQELLLATQQLNATQSELKATKARIQTLESQLRTVRHQNDELKSQLEHKQNECERITKNRESIKEDFIILQERERNLRQTSTSELYDKEQSLARERGVVVRLQAAISEKQKLTETLENELSRLQTNLDSLITPEVSRNDTGSRIESLEDQLAKSAQAFTELEKERQRIVSTMNESLERVQEERNEHTITQRHLAKSFVVIEEADKCINHCLEASQITSKDILHQVEFFRTLMRELKTGTLFSVESVRTDDAHKLKLKVNILTKELAVIQACLTKTGEERKVDLQKYSFLADKMRNELLCAMEKAVNAFRLRNF